MELDTAAGKHDGSVFGVRYFSCPPKHGVFAPPSRVQRYCGVNGVGGDLGSMGWGGDVGVNGDSGVNGGEWGPWGPWGHWGQWWSMGSMGTLGSVGVNGVNGVYMAIGDPPPRFPPRVGGPKEEEAADSAEKKAEPLSGAF